MFLSAKHIMHIYLGFKDLIEVCNAATSFCVQLIKPNSLEGKLSSTSGGICNWKFRVFFPTLLTMGTGGQNS